MFLLNIPFLDATGPPFHQALFTAYLLWSSSILVVSFANHHIPHPTPTRKQCHDRIIMQICNTILPSSFRFILHARLLTHNLRMSYICHRPLSNYSSPFFTLFVNYKSNIYTALLTNFIFVSVVLPPKTTFCQAKMLLKP